MAKLTHKIKKIMAFTLAEVLITLAIIGVVAAITIPSVINSYRKEAYVTQLKKNYTSIIKAFKTAMAREGVFRLQDTTLFITAGNHGISASMMAKAEGAEIKNEFTKLFNVIAIYGQYKIPVENGKIIYKGLSTATYEIEEAVVLADGTYLNLDLLGSPNSSPYSNLSDFQRDRGTASKFWQHLGYIYIDVNGPKPPNVIGRDLFQFWVGTDGNLYPAHGSDSAILFSSGCNDANIMSCGDYWRYDNQKYCNPNVSGTQNGYGCAARIMEEDWKMKY